MSLLGSIRTIADDFRQARCRYLTERSIRSLPSEIQKDIGWPEAYCSDRTRRFSVGGWAGVR